MKECVKWTEVQGMGGMMDEYGIKTFNVQNINL